MGPTPDELGPTPDELGPTPNERAVKGERRATTECAQSVDTVQWIFIKDVATVWYAMNTLKTSGCLLLLYKHTRTPGVLAGYNG